MSGYRMPLVPVKSLQSRPELHLNFQLISNAPPPNMPSLPASVPSAVNVQRQPVTETTSQPLSIYKTDAGYIQVGRGSDTYVLQLSLLPRVELKEGQSVLEDDGGFYMEFMFLAQPIRTEVIYWHQVTDEKQQLNQVQVGFSCFIFGCQFMINVS